MVQQPLLGQSLLVFRLHDHTQTHHARYDSSGRVISPTQRLLPHSHSLTRHRLPCAPVEFEPTSEWPQTHATAHSLIFTVMLYCHNLHSLLIGLLIILSMLHVDQIVYRAILCCKCEKELGLCERSVLHPGHTAAY